MRWEDERYVRVYTRDTITWKMLPWQGKALLALLFRKVDRAGLIDVGEYGPHGLAALLDLPVEVVTEGLGALIKSKTAQWVGGGSVLFVPNFLAAQEAPQSDAQRKRDQRERVVAKSHLEAFGLSQNVTDGHENGQIVTPGHAESQVVTSGHSDLIRSEPSLSENKHTSPPAPLELISSEPYKPDLETAYKLFPRKEGKSKGMKRLQRVITTPAKYERFVGAVRTYAAHVAGRELDKVKQFDSFVTVWEDYADGMPFTPAASSVAPSERSRPSMPDAEEYSRTLAAARGKSVA